MKIGQMVMLVGCDDFMPPLGTVGEIVGGLDCYGDHEVWFPYHPCPVSEVTWEIPARWLMPLDDGPKEKEIERDLEYALSTRLSGGPLDVSTTQDGRGRPLEPPVRLAPERDTMEMLKTFVLHVEPFAGSDVRDVAMELCQLADRVGVRCEAGFNGVKLWARPGDNPLRLVEAFHRELKRPQAAHKIAQAD